MRPLALAAAIAVAPALFAAHAQQAPTFGPGIAGPANPLTFNAVNRPGIAGPANPLTFDPTTRPGIAGPPNPLVFDATTAPGIAGIAPLNGGFAAPVVNPGVGDPGAFPVLTRPGIAGTTLAPGIAGPVNPLTFDPIARPGIAGTTFAPGIAGPAFFGTTPAVTDTRTAPVAPDRSRPVVRPGAPATVGIATGALVITNGGSGEVRVEPGPQAPARTRPVNR